MFKAFKDEVPQLQRFNEKISSAYHRVQPAFEKLTSDVMQNIVRFIDSKRSVALSIVRSGVRAVI
jgi:hypothetical protein